MSVDFRKFDLKKWNDDPFYKWGGLEIIEYREGYAKMHLNVEEHHRGGGGTKAVNGGIVAYMLDGLLGICTATVWDEETIGMVTVSMNIQYVGMLQADKIVIGEAEVIKRGKNTVFLEGHILDEQGELACTCTGIYRLRRRKKK